MPHLATIESLPMAFEMVKAMQAEGLDWSEGYRPLGRQALAAIIEGRMVEAFGLLEKHGGNGAVDGSAEHAAPLNPGGETCGI